MRHGGGRGRGYDGDGDDASSSDEDEDDDDEARSRRRTASGGLSLCWDVVWVPHDKPPSHDEPHPPVMGVRCCVCVWEAAVCWVDLQPSSILYGLDYSEGKEVTIFSIFEA